MGATTDFKRLFKEVVQLKCHIDKLSDGQVKMLEYNDENVVSFVIEVTPNDGPYKGGRFKFAFRLPFRYPVVPPIITCLNHIYHPNIDDDGDICLSLLDNWDSATDDISLCIQGVLYLFHHPNLEDPLSPYFCPEDANDIEIYYQNVKRSLEGGTVEGFRFERTLYEKCK